MDLFKFPIDISLKPSEDILAWLSNHLFEEAGQGRDLSNSVVVFPGRRPGLYLRRRLGRLFGSSYLPPKIFDIDSFMAWLCACDGWEALKETNDLDLLHILHQVCTQQDDERVSFMLRDLDFFFFWGRRLLDLFEEFSVELIPPERLQALIPQALRESGLNEDVKGIWPLLPELYAKWQAALKKAGVLSRGERYRVAAERIKDMKLPCSKVYFAGFVALNRAEEEVIRCLHALGKAVVLAQPLEGDSPSPLLFEKIELVSSADIHGQLFEAVQKMGTFSKASEIGDEEVVLVLPRPSSLIPVLNWVLEDLGQPYNISMGMPLDRTPMARLLLAIFTAQQNRSEGLYYYRHYNAIVSHPYVQALARSKGISTEAITPSTCLSPYISLARIVSKENESLLDLLFKNFEKCDCPGSLVESACKLMNLLEEEHIVGDYPLASEMMNSLYGLLHYVHKSGFAAMPSSAKEISAFMAQLVRTSRIPMPGMPLKGIQVLGFLETRCLSFKNVFIFDLNEGVLPPEQRPDPILPPMLRRGLGLPPKHRAVQISRYHFLRLVEGAEKVILCYTEDKGSIRSRFVEELVWAHERASKELWDQKSEEMNIFPNFHNRSPAPIPKTSNLIERVAGRAFSPSSIDTYLHCPLRFYLRYGLGLEEPEQTGPDPSPALVGTVIHGVLQRMYEPLKGKEFDRELMPNLGEIIKEELSFVLGDDPALSGIKEILFEILRYRLDSFVEKDVERCKGYTLLDVEHEVRLTLDLPQTGCVKLRGIIDRLEKEKQGIIWVIDYKTGSKLKLPDLSMGYVKNRYEMKHSIKSFQLPIYLLMADNALSLKGDWNRINAALFHLKGIGAPTKLETTMKRLFSDGVNHVAAMNEVFIPSLKFLLQELLNPNIPFEPDVSEPEYCSSCPYSQNVCTLA